MTTCTRNCFGVADYAASCCRLEDRDFIHGPVTDAKATFVMDASERYPCPFLGTDHRCGIYEDRPDLCRDYRCDHLQEVIDVL